MATAGTISRRRGVPPLALRDRHQSGAQPASLEEWTDPGDATGATGEGQIGAASLERAERAAAVRDAIAALPAELREAIVLFEYEEMSHTEIAGVVGATPKAVETRIYRAKEKLRVALRRWVSD